jgi:hypothetical protein
MRVSKVVVIVGAIKVSWHNGYIIGTVLHIITLAHFYARYFGYAVWFA